MSCSVKISSGKSWSGSQRRIGSLPEETPPGYTVQAAPQTGNVQTNQSSTTNTSVTNSATGSYALVSQNIHSVSTTGQPPRPVKSIAARKGEDTTKLLKYIDDSVIGKNGTFFGPFGRRKGRCLCFIFFGKWFFD